MNKFRLVNSPSSLSDSELRMLLRALAADFGARVDGPHPLTRKPAQARLERMIELAGALTDHGLI